jgi:hypothetical protein
LVYLLGFTLLCISWSLWVRRLTWHCRWEVAATLNVALQGGAVILMSPWASRNIGLRLHELTGHHNLEDLLAHDMYIVAASAIVYNTIGRLGNDSIMQRRFSMFVEKPATLCIPLMFASFTLSNGSSMYEHDFFDVPTDAWLKLYWTTMCIMLIWLLSYSARSLLVLRRQPQNARVATTYLAAAACGIAACLVRLVTAYTPQSIGPTPGASFIWIFACLCGAGFAVSSAYSWTRKTRWFSSPSKVTT